MESSKFGPQRSDLLVFYSNEDVPIQILRSLTNIFLNLLNCERYLCVGDMCHSQRARSPLNILCFHFYSLSPASLALKINPFDFCI